MNRQGRERAEFAFFAAITVISFSLHLQALKIVNPGFDILGPGFAPRYLTIIVGGLSALIALGTLFKIIRPKMDRRYAADNRAATISKNRLRFLAASVVTLVYVVIVAEELLSFWIGSSLYIFAMQIILSVLQARRVGLAILTTAITIGFAYMVTSQVFDKAL